MCKNAIKTFVIHFLETVVDIWFRGTMDLSKGTVGSGTSGRELTADFLHVLQSENKEKYPYIW